MAGAVVDLLDAGEQIGALGNARVHLPARLVARGRRVGIGGARDGRRQQRAGIGRGIGARAALDDVGAAAAGEGVVAVVADQHIGPGVAGDGVVAAAAVGVLDRRERRRSAHARGCARGQIDADAGAIVRVADRIAAGAAVNRRGAAVVLEMEVRRGVAAVDDLAIAPEHIDADRLCDGCAVRVVVDDGPDVEGRGRDIAADVRAGRSAEGVGGNDKRHPFAEDATGVVDERVAGDRTVAAGGEVRGAGPILHQVVVEAQPGGGGESAERTRVRARPR